MRRNHGYEWAWRFLLYAVFEGVLNQSQCYCWWRTCDVLDSEPGLESPIPGKKYDSMWRTVTVRLKDCYFIMALLC